MWACGGGGWVTVTVGRISAVFDGAMARDPAERPQFVRDAVPTSRREEVESMLAEIDPS